jgi:hypothetical protein
MRALLPSGWPCARVAVIHGHIGSSVREQPDKSRDRVFKSGQGQDQWTTVSWAGRHHLIKLDRVDGIAPLGGQHMSQVPLVASLQPVGTQPRPAAACRSPLHHPDPAAVSLSLVHGSASANSNNLVQFKEQNELFGQQPDLPVREANTIAIYSTITSWYKRRSGLVPASGFSVHL